MSSVLLCGISFDHASLLYRDFLKCLCRLEQALAPDACFIPGGGQLEETCMHFLCCSVRSHPVLKIEEGDGRVRKEGRKSTLMEECLRKEAVRAFASGLGGFLATLKTNLVGVGETKVFKTIPCGMDLPRSVELLNVKLLLWRKAVDYVRLFHTLSYENRK